MAVTKEFSCEIHGHFEGKFAVCPHGCIEEVERIFTVAPATVSRRTKNIDSTLRGIAQDHKLSDLSNKKGSLAASMPQFQPAPPPPQEHPMQQAIAARMMQVGARFGGNFVPGPGGSFWRDSSSVQGGSKAIVKGHMDQISGLPNKVEVSSVVQHACDNNGRIIK